MPVIIPCTDNKTCSICANGRWPHFAVVIEENGSDAPRGQSKTVLASIVDTYYHDRRMIDNAVRAELHSQIEHLDTPLRPTDLDRWHWKGAPEGQWERVRKLFPGGL